jgi:hypothetical protein
MDSRSHVHGTAVMVRYPAVLLLLLTAGCAARYLIRKSRSRSPGRRSPPPRPPGSLTNVQSGDVLVSHPTAVREHEISIVPNAPHTMSPTHDAAVSDGCSEADALGVDAWLTEDQTHVVKIASNRTPDK